MIVPEYWAEARLQKRVNDRQITVRRFGWSDLSQEDAQAMADARADNAFVLIAAGEDLPRREQKVAYEGTEGTPIREEILTRFGETVITRNTYGAHCLNTPNVLFADVDFLKPVSTNLILAIHGIIVILAIVLGVIQSSIQAAGITLLIGLFSGYPISGLAHWLWELATGGNERRARRKIAQFIGKNPSWHLRIYRTPAGFRILVMHQLFDPVDPATKACLDALDTDPLYIRLCLNQHCFRARVSPKPWRIGIKNSMRPRPGVWPIKPERLPERQRWVAEYEARAVGFASCRFVEALGNVTAVHPDAHAVQVVHDELCRAHTQMPTA